jgi:hypothetical protein
MPHCLIRAACPLLAAAVVVSSARAQWPTYQGDIQHTGYTSATVDPSQIAVGWQAPQGYGVPLIVGNTVYAMRNGQGSGDSTTIRSFNAATGAANWTYTNKFDFPSEPTYSNGSLYFVGQMTPNTPALFAIDAATGTQRYTVPLPNTTRCGFMPTIYTAPNGSQTALIMSDSSGGGQSMTAVSLGTSSGSILWQRNKTLLYGGVPTVIGNSVIATGPGQFYAFDLASGAVNLFHSGNISGGGNATAVADVARSRVFIPEAFSQSAFGALTAYSYVNNSTITQLWQRTDSAIVNGSGVAVAADGKVYTVNKSTLFELDGATGSTLRSVGSRSFANGSAPVITNGKVWAYEQINLVNGVSEFDLATFTFEHFFPINRGDTNTPFKGPGAFATGMFAADAGNIYGQEGFKMLFVPVPEPGAFLATVCGLLTGIGLRVRRPAPIDFGSSQFAG